MHLFSPENKLRGFANGLRGKPFAFAPRAPPPSVRGSEANVCNGAFCPSDLLTPSRFLIPLSPRRSSPEGAIPSQLAAITRPLIASPDTWSWSSEQRRIG